MGGASLQKYHKLTPQGRYLDLNSNFGEIWVFLPICNVCVEFSFRHLKLTAEQKCDIAQRELEELRDEIEKLKDESEKILDNFRVGQQIILIKKTLINIQALFPTYHKVKLNVDTYLSLQGCHGRSRHQKC